MVRRQPARASVSVSDLVHDDGRTRIPASDVAWGRIERVTTEEPDLPVAFVGPIPDVIIEDHEYLCALRDAVQRLEKTETALARSLLWEALALRVPPPSVATAIDVWPQDPAHLLEYRERVGRMVEKAARATRREGGIEKAGSRGPR